MPAPTLQVAPAPAEAVPFVGTFLLGWALLTFTAQVAASLFLPDPSWRRAPLVGLGPAAVSMALIRFDPLVIVAVGLAVDAVAVHSVYRVGPRTTALVVLVHYSATVGIVLVLATLAALLSTAPG